MSLQEIRDRKFITDPRDASGLCNRWKIRHFKTNPLKMRSCTQSQLQLISLLLALQPSVTSKIVPKFSPKVQTMLPTKSQIHFGGKDQFSPSWMVQGKRQQHFWVLTIGYCSHHLKHVTKDQSILVLRTHTGLSSEFQMFPFMLNYFKSPRYHEDNYNYR